jgi:hypothetical protein
MRPVPLCLRRQKKIIPTRHKRYKKEMAKTLKKINEYQDTKENKISFGFWVDFLYFVF